MNMKFELEIMTLEISEIFETPHCMKLRWSIFWDSEKKEYTLNLCVHYPLTKYANFMGWVFADFDDTDSFIRILKRDAIKCIDELVKKEARRWGYSKKLKG